MALMLIFSSHQLLRFFGSAAEGQFPLYVAVQLVLVQWPILLGYFLPLFLFLSIIATYARFNQSQEMVVLRCSGIGLQKLLGYTMRFAVLMLVFEAFFVFAAKPWLGHTFQTLKAEAVNTAPLQWVTPGKFQSLNHGNVVYYAEGNNASRDQITQVFTAFKTSGHDHWDVMFAEAGHHESRKHHGGEYVVLTHGHQYSGEPGSANYQTGSFEKLSKRIALVSEVGPSNAKFAATSQLWHKRNIPFFAAELHWRAAGVISMLLLVFLAIPLSHAAPRKGVYTRMIIAVLAYSIYVSWLLVTRSWIKQGHIGSEMGMWGVHLAMAGFVVGMYLWQERARYFHLMKQRVS
mgnify:CR=1 FL=1